MSLLTKAVVQSTRPRGPRAGAVVGLVALTVVATALLLLHVQLRLAIGDLNIETSKRQKEKNRRTSEVNQLRNDIERLLDNDRADVAQAELGMVPSNPSEYETLTIDAQRLEAWKKCRPDAPSKKPLINHLEVALEKTEAQAQTIEAFWKILRPQLTEAQ